MYFLIKFAKSTISLYQKPINMLKRLLLISIVLLSGCSILTPLQKSRFITISNLIESAKYTEAKESIDALIEDEESAKWPRTWYMRGLLSQTAYHDGKSKNNNDWMNLYPDQIFFALESYEKALSLDKGGKIEKDIAPKYVLLANEYQALGDLHFKNKKFTDALKAFEAALKVISSPILAVELDLNLVQNAAIAAYEDRNWDRAIHHLRRLHNKNFGVNATHLLYEVNLEKGDTLAAKQVIVEGMTRHNDHEDLVLLLTDLLFNEGDIDGALKNLDRVIARNPTNATFRYTKGLVYQRNEQYQEAINTYTQALSHSPDDPMIFLNLAICHYNTGVNIEEGTRTITNNSRVQEEKAKSKAAFDSATFWLDKIYNMGTTDRTVLSKAYELYKALRINDKADNLEDQLK